MNKRRALIATVLIWCVVIAVLAIPAARQTVAFSTLAAKRNPYCSWFAAVRGFLNHRSGLKVPASKARLKQAGPEYSLWSTPIGDFWSPHDQPGKLLAFMWQETDDRRIYGAARKGDIVLDCGANIGMVTRTMLNDGAALVVAIEPLPENLECLRRNLAKEIEARRVILYPKGVWDRDDVLEMSFENSGGASFVVDRHAGALKLPLTTIDKLVAELQLPRVDLIKMDIEGSETHALAGARETLRRYRPRLSIASYHLPSDPARIPEVVRAAQPGYEEECGSCRATPQGVLPEVLRFH